MNRKTFLSYGLAAAIALNSAVTPLNAGGGNSNPPQEYTQSLGTNPVTGKPLPSAEQLEIMKAKKRAQLEAKLASSQIESFATDTTCDANTPCPSKLTFPAPEATIWKPVVLRHNADGSTLYTQLGIARSTTTADRFSRVMRSSERDLRTDNTYNTSLCPGDWLEIITDKSPGAYSFVPTNRNTSTEVAAAKDFKITYDELVANNGKVSVTYNTKKTVVENGKKCQVSNAFEIIANANPTCTVPKTEPPFVTVIQRDSDEPDDSSSQKRTKKQYPQLPAKKEFNITLRKGVSQYTFGDSKGNTYDPLDFDINQVAMRYRYMGEKAKVDLQGALTNGTDNAGLNLSAFDAEAHVDYKLMRSNVAPGLSGAVGYKDVRTYQSFLPGWNADDTRQANGYGYAGVNLSFTGDGGFASGNWLVARAGVVAQPIIDKNVTFGNAAYASTTDMELAVPEFSFDARKQFTQRTWLDFQGRFSPKIKTAYTSPNVTRELTKTSDYKNVSVGLGHMFGNEMKHGVYAQLKWADNKEEWKNFVDNLGHLYTATGRHEGLAVGIGYTYRFGDK